MKKPATFRQPAALALADAWVDPARATEKPARLSIDMPAKVHREFKVACAERGVKMADIARELIETWIATSG